MALGRTMLSESTSVFRSLKPAAAAALGAAIETMEPSAAALESTGMAFQLAQYLVTIIKSGAPDLNELKCHGLSQDTAVAIATAISKRHARKAAAIAAMRPMAPEPQPAASKPPKPALAAAIAAIRPVPAPKPPITHKPERREDVINAALSLLHDLALQLDSQRGDAGVLHSAGFSSATSKELAKYINASRTGVW
jgi:hypothetical protein